MRKYNKEVTSSQEFYEISQKELDEIKSFERDKGRTEIATYILYCYTNYIYKMNIGGAMEFIKDVLDFLARKKDEIPNKHNVTFFDFIKKN